MTSQEMHIGVRGDMGQTGQPPVGSVETSSMCTVPFCSTKTKHLKFSLSNNAYKVFYCLKQTYQLSLKMAAAFIV